MFEGIKDGIFFFNSLFKYYFLIYLLNIVLLCSCDSSLFNFYNFVKKRKCD